MFWTDDNIAKLWRYPDKMNETTANMLKEFDAKKGYVAQAKLDGHRLIAMGDGSQVRGLSRHKKPIPVSQVLLDRLANLGIPSPWMLDTEWIGRRGGSSEQIAILDALYIGGEWQGSKNLYDRREVYYNLDMPDGIIKPDEAVEGFVEFFARQIDTLVAPKETLSEGVVIKKISAKLIGDRRDSAKNPFWSKIKWRAGQGGDTVIVTKEMADSL